MRLMHTPNFIAVTQHNLPRKSSVQTCAYGHITGIVIYHLTQIDLVPYHAALAAACGILFAQSRLLLNYVSRPAQA